MEEKEYKDITEWMADKLRSHRMPYEEGAWERFQEAERMAVPRQRNLWPWAAVAATILVCFAVFFNKEPITKTSPVAQRPSVIQQTPPSKVIDPDPVTDVKMLYQAPAKKAEPTGFVPVITPPVDEVSQRRLLEVKASVTATLADHIVQAARATKETKPALEKSEQGQKTKDQKAEDVAALWATVDITEETSATEIEKDTRNWNFGLAVAPTMSKDKVNVGGGITVEYALSNKVSIRSGINYMELDAHRGTRSNPSNMLASPSTSGAAIRPANKTLNSVYTSLAGLDIPLNVEYKLDDRFFASAGVSVFGILNEKRTHRFKSEVQELSYAKGDMSQKPMPMIKTMYTSEPAVNEPYEDRSFTGFVNFSVGYKMPFSSKINLSLEPFYKIPVGGGSVQDMDLTNGGIRITAGF